MNDDKREVIWTGCECCGRPILWVPHYIAKYGVWFYEVVEVNAG